MCVDRGVSVDVCACVCACATEGDECGSLVRACKDAPHPGGLLLKGQSASIRTEEKGNTISYDSGLPSIESKTLKSEKTCLLTVLRNSSIHEH